MTSQQLRDLGYVEVVPGRWEKVGFHAPVPGEPEVMVQATPKAKRIRQSSKPKLNKLETRFHKHLIALYADGGARIHVQSITFVLANGVRYTPDFVVFYEDKNLAYEVKGKHAWDDAIVKLKVAATTYQDFTFVLTWHENETWVEQGILP